MLGARLELTGEKPGLLESQDRLRPLRARRPRVQVLPAASPHGPRERRSCQSREEGQWKAAASQELAAQARFASLRSRSLVPGDQPGKACPCGRAGAGLLCLLPRASAEPAASPALTESFSASCAWVAGTLSLKSEERGQVSQALWFSSGTLAACALCQEQVSEERPCWDFCRRRWGPGAQVNRAGAAFRGLRCSWPERAKRTLQGPRRGSLFTHV